MLANGATLKYKERGAEGDYEDLPGLKEIPDMGSEKEKVDNTVLTAQNKQYEYGIGDAGDITYKFKYDNTSAKSPYRLMRNAEAKGKVLSFKETLSDGTTTEFDAQVSVKRTGGGVNSVIDFNLNMAIQSDFEYTDPA